MAHFVAVFNSTSAPVVVDAEGHTVGGGEWGMVNRNTEVVRLAVNSGRLVVSSDPGGDRSGVNKDAKAVFEQVEQANVEPVEDKSSSTTRKTPKDAA